MNIPSAVEVREYAESLGYRLNAEHFLDYYELRGWCVGRTPIKSWKAAVRIWKGRAEPHELIHPPIPVDNSKLEQKKVELRQVAEREYQRRNGERRKDLEVA